MGYTSGVAEKLYKRFENGTYLTLETYPKMSRKDAIKKFTEEYEPVEPSEIEDFLQGNDDYIGGEDVDLYANLDDTYKVSQKPYDFVEELSEYGWEYTLTDDGQDRMENGEEVEEEDFLSIKLAIAGEHLGDVAVWYDLIKNTVGGYDFEDKSVNQFNSDIDDGLRNMLDAVIYEINHN